MAEHSDVKVIITGVHLSVLGLTISQYFSTVFGLVLVVFGFLITVAVWLD